MPELPAALRARTAAMARDAAAHRKAHLREQVRPSRGVMRSVVALAAAAAVAAAVVGVVDVWPSIAGPRSATAEVVDTIRRARAVRFTRQFSGSKVRVLEDGGVVRQEHPDGTVTIMDYTKGKLLLLDPTAKTAVRGTIAGDDIPEGESVLALFRNQITSADGALVGRVPFGDAEADEYRFSFEDGEGMVRMWVDRQTHLPLKAVFQGQNWLPAGDVTYGDFDWNPAFDAGHMTVDVPVGYAIDELRTIDMLAMTRAAARHELTAALACVTCLTDFLAIYAERFQDAFPDGLDADACRIKGFALILPLSEQDRQRHGGDTQDAIHTRSKHVSEKWENLLRLTSSLQALGREMHYLGKGRSRGDGKGPIAWWPTFDGQTCIVVADDLSFKEVPSSSLSLP